MLSASPLCAADIVFDGRGERLVISGEDLAEVSPYFSDGEAAIVFRLSKDDAVEFSELTGRLIGEVLEVSICGNVVAAPIVRDQLSGAGIVPLPNLDAAIAYTDALKGDAPCP